VSFVKRIAAEDQTAVVVAEADYIAVLLFFGEPYAENFDDPDAVVLLGASEAGQLAAALVEAAERMRVAA
jgi:hypothetical protein